MRRDGADLRRQAAKCSVGEEAALISGRRPVKRGKHRASKPGRRTDGLAAEPRTEMKSDGADLRRQAAKCSEGAEPRAESRMYRASCAGSWAIWERGS